MKKHTPGPWTIEPRVKTAINAGEKHIAMVNFYKCGNPTRDVLEDEHTANVNLISAAPDLLEALEMMMSEFSQHGGRIRGTTLDIARAAIAKATAV